MEGQEEKQAIQLLQQEKRLNAADRIPVVLGFDFYVRPLSEASRISRDDKHSSHTIDISPEGFGFLFPALKSFEEDHERSGSVSKNAVLEIILYYQNKRFRFNAQRAWAQLQYIDDARFFRYGVKWLFLDDSQTITLKYILDLLKNEENHK